MRSKSRRTLAAALIAAGASTMTPAPVEAGCTEDYVQCQISAWQKSNWVIRELKFIECFAGYVGCVKDASGF